MVDSHQNHRILQDVRQHNLINNLVVRRHKSMTIHHDAFYFSFIQPRPAQTLACHLCSLSSCFLWLFTFPVHPLFVDEQFVALPIRAATRSLTVAKSHRATRIAQHIVSTSQLRQNVHNVFKLPSIQRRRVLSHRNKSSTKAPSEAIVMCFVMLVPVRHQVVVQ